MTFPACTKSQTSNHCCCNFLDPMIRSRALVCWYVQPGTRCFAYDSDADTGRCGHSLVAGCLGDRVFRESSVPGNAPVCGSGEAIAIWSVRRCKPAACILGPSRKIAVHVLPRPRTPRARPDYYHYYYYVLLSLTISITFTHYYYYYYNHDYHEHY